MAYISIPGTNLALCIFSKITVFTVLCTCSWGTVRSFTHGVGLVPLMSLYQKYIFILSGEYMTFAMFITKKSCKILCNLLDFFVINIANVHVLLYFFPIVNSNQDHQTMIISLSLCLIAHNKI